MQAEEQLIAARRGKWSQPAVPHRGWICTDIEELREPQLICEMCESQIIRYVHYMQHPDFREILRVGCICAGNMEQDLNAARRREAAMQNRSARRRRWLTRKWRISARGNPWLRSDGYRVIIYRRRQGWAATISSEDNVNVHHSRINYPTMDQAKLAAFDHLTRLLAADQQ